MSVVYADSFCKRGMCLLILGSALLSSSLEARKLGQLDFHACSLPVLQTSMTVSAQCATMKVPENPAQPRGRQIELALAWIPAKGEAEPDPVFMIAGGPGQSALESYPSLHPVFFDVIKKRNIVLVDQRGTGKSTAVRSFAQMMFDRLPVTLPINATEDRVVGGWELNKLMLGQLESNREKRCR